MVLLPEVESVQNVSVAPGQMLGRGLFAGVFVNLLVNLPAVRGHVVVEPRHDGVTSRDLGPGQLSGRGPVTQLQQLQPVLVLLH